MAVFSFQFSGGSVLLASGETAVEGCFVRVCFSPRKNTENRKGLGSGGREFSTTNSTNATNRRLRFLGGALIPEGGELPELSG